VSEEPTEEVQEDENENDEQSTEHDLKSDFEDFRIDVDPIDYSSPDCQDVDLPTAWSGFKIVGDNIDKNLRQSYQGCDRQTVSPNYNDLDAIKKEFQVLVSRYAVARVKLYYRRVFYSL